MILSASWIYPSSSNKGKLFKIGQVYSKHNIPAELALDGTNTTAKNEDKPSTSGDEPSEQPSDGLFMVSTTNGLKTVIAKDKSSVNASVPEPPTVSAPKEVVEESSNQPDDLISNSDSRTSPLPLKISSVVSGEGVALMTNGLPIVHESDDSNDTPQISDVQSLASNSIMGLDDTSMDATNLNENDSNEFDDDLLEPKTEPIDISDDEQIDDSNISDTNATAENPTQTDYHHKGYIYCTTNVQLGKINIEWTSPTNVKLYLEQPVDIDCVENPSPQVRTKNLLTSVSKYMQAYIRSRFYGVYPAHLKLDWIFIETARFQQDAITLCDFNKLEPLSVRY